MTLSRRHFLALGAAALLPARAARAVTNRPDSLYHWNSGGPFFGGFSGIELSSDRRRALLLSDRGFIVRVRLLRDDAGVITGVEKIEHFVLNGTAGSALRGHRADSEGLDQRPDGTLHISFEGSPSRILQYRDETGPAEALPRANSWQRLPTNEGLEGIAVDQSGAVFTVPEAPLDGTFPLYRLTNQWEIVGFLPDRDDFRPVGLDFGPDGNLYLLERKFRLAFFASRISRLRPGAWGQPETLVETSMGALDNHEGISITQDASGQLWATTVSDDNQNMLQRTEIAEYRLP
ncbi:esterase-like activity of phytase family protein [Pararhodobacter zhoushanensis]|uniref:esterase-like activity of phytase family protein n=1 Tax=Pararhodobacter zhoushanensis TaxID=2479545 RepID=UPI000F8EB362|nr:esterase-like activity of phytase family protein [Pararhodobacter zhoushanensis]